jgi:hypothetical protein
MQFLDISRDSVRTSDYLPSDDRAVLVIYSNGKRAEARYDSNMNWWQSTYESRKLSQELYNCETMNISPIEWSDP